MARCFRAQRENCDISLDILPLLDIKFCVSIEFKTSFHAGDLEPESDQKYSQVQDIVETMLNQKHSGPTDWVWFIVDIIDWFKIQVNNDDYAKDPAAPWPHDFIVHDMVRAFAAMAMFFPKLEATALVTKFLKSDYCKTYRNSLLFDPKERGKTPPDRRKRTSYKHRSRSFWKDWKTLVDGPDYFTEAYPFDWSLAVRPIIAHCPSTLCTHFISHSSSR